MKQILVIFLWLGSGLIVHSQTTFYYGYDAAGNRISRSITLLKSTASTPDENIISQGSSEQVGKYGILLFPNPVQQELMVRINGLETGQRVEQYLFNLSGKLISLKTTLEADTRLDFTDKPAGIYILRIIIGKELTEWKIIRE
jgi:hypothetical protein